MGHKHWPGILIDGEWRRPSTADPLLFIIYQPVPSNLRPGRGPPPTHVYLSFCPRPTGRAPTANCRPVAENYVNEIKWVKMPWYDRQICTLWGRQQTATSGCSFLHYKQTNRPFHISIFVIGRLSLLGEFTQLCLHSITLRFWPRPRQVHATGLFFGRLRYPKNLSQTLHLKCVDSCLSPSLVLILHNHMQHWSYQCFIRRIFVKIDMLWLVAYDKLVDK